MYGYKRNTETPLLRVNYPSISSMQEARFLDKGHHNARQWRETVGRQKSKKWWGGNCNTFPQCEKLLRDGWQHGINQIDQLSSTLKHITKLRTKSRRKSFRDSQGYSIDIHRVYAGALDKAWRNTRRIDTHKIGPSEAKRVTLYVTLGGNAHISGDEMFYSPACALVLASHIVKSRIPVEIIAASATSRLTQYPKSSDSLVEITIKAFNAPFNMSSFVSTALGGFYRGYVWRCEALLAEENKQNLSYSWGGMLSLENVPEIEEAAKRKKSRVIIVPAIYNEKDAIQFIKEQIGEKRLIFSEGVLFVLKQHRDTLQAQLDEFTDEIPEI